MRGLGPPRVCAPVGWRLDGYSDRKLSNACSGSSSWDISWMTSRGRVLSDVDGQGQFSVGGLRLRVRAERFKDGTIEKTG